MPVDHVQEPVAGVRTGDIPQNAGGWWLVAGGWWPVAGGAGTGTGSGLPASLSSSSIHRTVRTYSTVQYGTVHYRGRYGTTQRRDTAHFSKRAGGVSRPPTSNLRRVRYATVLNAITI